LPHACDINNGCLCSEKAALYKKFLEASARGWVFAADQPEAAAELLTRLAAAENKDLPKALDAEMVLESQIFIAPVSCYQSWKGSWV